MKLKLNNGYNYISTSSVTVVITVESESHWLHPQQVITTVRLEVDI